MYAVHERDAKRYRLPGRDWIYLIGPENMGNKNLVFGLAEFPVDSKAGAHVHEKEEEVLFILSGWGEITMGGRVEKLEPGCAIYIPPGLEHHITVQGVEPLKLVTVFSPPVTPGSYDRSA